MQTQISFVIIGRNQAATICASVASAFRAAKAASLSSFEILYVDSDSTDDSVSRIHASFGESVRLIRLTGARNAGIARNVGAARATGRAVFFIDGDMEVDPSFLTAALNERGELIHPVVTGQLPEKIYETGGRFIADSGDRYRIGVGGYRAVLGGVFIIERAVFEMIGGFAPEMRCNEDVDLGFRLASIGQRVLALPRPIALHHTVDYFEWTRLLQMIRDGSLFYPAALFRRHFAESSCRSELLVHQRSTVVLLASAAVGLLLHPAGLLVYPGYLGLKHLLRPQASFVRDAVGTTARSVCFLAGLFVFFPARVPPGAITYVEALDTEPAATDGRTLVGSDSAAT